MNPATENKSLAGNLNRGPIYSLLKAAAVLLVLLAAALSKE
jgi:hypothetical protein